METRTSDGYVWDNDTDRTEVELQAVETEATCTEDESE